MCRPEHFTVSYRINPWMEPANPTDTAVALQQWQTLYDTYIALGHEVQLIDPIPGLPDMVYTANGGFVIDGVAYGAKFRFQERVPEAPAFMEWFRENGFE
ncbi:dimethylarginine dimethylaminohydrolase family protein, partial [Microbacterium sp.]|uniref:dimethylarginine dimethylaminohydrolase family protein n=1 Tax=Microbacterium sp. TaxID=51671 RepID=UPI002D8684E8|nr:N-dimethylarginine dimethylaminohydrolase [Microbacterium sp.]